MIAPALVFVMLGCASHGWQAVALYAGAGALVALDLIQRRRLA